MKNVKNIILGMVFLFGMSVPVDAKTIVIADKCYDQAVSETELYGDLYGFDSPEQEAEMLNDNYAICMVGLRAFLAAQ